MAYEWEHIAVRCDELVLLLECVQGGAFGGPCRRASLGPALNNLLNEVEGCIIDRHATIQLAEFTEKRKHNTVALSAVVRTEGAASLEIRRIRFAPGQASTAVKAADAGLLREG